MRKFVLYFGIFDYFNPSHKIKLLTNVALNFDIFVSTVFISLPRSALHFKFMTFENASPYSLCDCQKFVT